MESQTAAAAEFRDGQRQQWRKGAEGWRKRSDFIDAATAHVSKRMVELADVEPGSRVLDVAAGYGEPSLTAAAVAGAEGKVVATDISPDMLAYGRERAATAGLQNVEFVESEAATLDFPPESFDAALSRFGIIFEPEAEAAAARVRGFLGPGVEDGDQLLGTAGAGAVHRASDGDRDAHARRRPAPAGDARPALAPDTGRAGAAARGRRVLRRRGRGDRGQLRVGVRRGVRRDGQGHSPPLVALIARHVPDDPDRAWDAILGAVKERASDDGTVTFSNLVLIAVGRA